MGERYISTIPVGLDHRDVDALRTYLQSVNKPDLIPLCSDPTRLRVEKSHYKIDN
jgi:hypothetical protein